MKYRNPVIPGFHPDPSFCRVGEDYYLVTSSFEYFPGVPVYHSRDLVHWEQIGHALTRDSQLPLQNVGRSRGIYAPTIRYHNGRFYIITTNVDSIGNFIVTADHPAGPWSEPVLVDQPGIDPSLFFDDDGKVYYTGTHHDSSGVQGIGLFEIDPNTGARREETRIVWYGTGWKCPEAPHLYKINGLYYLMIAEGGTEYGHMVTIARASSPYGPYEACPGNPILTHASNRMRGSAIAGTGHADLLQAHDGSWWMVFLAFRPTEQYFHHLGRETFLCPVRWENGWPVVNDGRPVRLEMDAPCLPFAPVPAPQGRELFSAGFSPQWNWLRDRRGCDDRYGQKPDVGRAQAGAVCRGMQNAPAAAGAPGRGARRADGVLRRRASLRSGADGRQAAASPARRRYLPYRVRDPVGGCVRTGGSRGADEIRVFLWRAGQSEAIRRQRDHAPRQHGSDAAGLYGRLSGALRREGRAGAVPVVRVRAAGRIIARREGCGAKAPI